MKTQDFLLELGCEELPPKLLQKLSIALKDNLAQQLDQLKLAYIQIEAFATPRRLAVLVHDLQCLQNDQLIERKGPAISAPAQAIAGFAKSYGVAQAALTKKTLNDTEYYFFTATQLGLKTKDLLEVAVSTAIKNIPIAKPMRWGDSGIAFARPIHWLVMMLGTDVVPAKVMGLTAGNTTRGLRFTGEQVLTIEQASDYRQNLLDKAQIEVDFETRKSLIRTQVKQVAVDSASNNATAIIDEGLLNEVCALVEYPRAFVGKFDAKFLDVPKEVLISAMKLHQKYFHLVDAEGQLLPMFISVANIESSNLSVIINGNERVIRSRLSDAEFFWTQDKATPLARHLDKLSSVLFMQGLGSMADKAKRIQTLAAYVAEQIGANIEHSKRAAQLCKSDLVADVVGEFADLQGVMGGYYALNDGENTAVATAISEHYLPRFSGDSLPSTPEGLSVAIADKIDSIVGIYGIGHKPTGSKDHYALKRAALGLLRMMIEAKLKLGIRLLVNESAKSFDFKIDTQELTGFILERLGAYYQEQDIGKNIIKAVLKSQENKIETHVNSVYDWHLRVEALQIFMQNKDAKSLVEANKRIKNILKGVNPEEHKMDSLSFDLLLSQGNAFDKNLSQAISNMPISDDYEKTINEFLLLKPVIDDFFDNVMINDENLELRKLRLHLVSLVRALFLNVADFAYLSKGSSKPLSF